MKKSKTNPSKLTFTEKPRGFWVKPAQELSKTTAAFE
jgi:hypothetical protein